MARSFANKYNKARKFAIDTTGFQYASMADLFNAHGANHVYPVRALYINTKGKFADSPVIATESEFVNCPAHMTDTVRDIIADDEAIEMINGGAVGFQIYQYENVKYNRDCFGIRFVDIDPETGKAINAVIVDPATGEVK